MLIRATLCYCEPFIEREACLRRNSKSPKVSRLRNGRFRDDYLICRSQNWTRLDEFRFPTLVQCWAKNKRWRLAVVIANGRAEGLERSNRELLEGERHPHYIHRDQGWKLIFRTTNCQTIIAHYENFLNRPIKMLKHVMWCYSLWLVNQDNANQRFQTLRLKPLSWNRCFRIFEGSCSRLSKSC